MFLYQPHLSHPFDPLSLVFPYHLADQQVPVDLERQLILLCPPHLENQLDPVRLVHQQGHHDLEHQLHHQYPQHPGIHPIQQDPVLP